MKHKYKTVVFDLDGTLMDTLGDLTDSTNQALVSFGLPPRTREEVGSFLGNGVRPLMEKAVPGGTAYPQFEEVFRYFVAYYSGHSEIKTKPFDGMTETIDQLKAEGYKVAIVSNKFDAAVKKLNHTYFGERFQVAIGEQENVRKKPAPDSVYEALRQLGAEASTAVYIGDTEVDVMTAENAGIDCILVSWGFRSREILETFKLPIAEWPTELLELV